MDPARLEVIRRDNTARPRRRALPCAARLTSDPPPLTCADSQTCHRSLAVFNSVQNFLTTSLTRRIYSKAPAYGPSPALACPLLLADPPSTSQ